MRYTALASDYDGTIAEHGRVHPATLAALQRFRDAGGELILVTGREVVDLQNIFPSLAVFHWILAENGAVLYELATDTETLLAQAPSPEFLDLLRLKGVSPLYVGRVIIASFDDQLPAINEAIEEMGVAVEVIPNKGAAMILPVGCDKASGLRAFFSKTARSQETTVGVGDAENDLPLLEACGLGVALENALDSLKEKADWVMSQPAGAGVAELIERLLALEDVAKEPVQHASQNDRGR